MYLGIFRKSLFNQSIFHHISIESTKTKNNSATRVSRCYSGRKRRGWPGGRHASPTELKMRSGITTISVNFPTFPANQSFRPTAESMRPRAKSFIRPISQIEANRQKFSLSMTSEVRKCPKSAKSDRNSDVFARAVERGGETFCNVKLKCAHRSGGWKWLVRNDPQRGHHLHFWEIMIFFQKSISRSKNKTRELSINGKNSEKECVSSNFLNCFHLVSLTDYEIKVAIHIFLHKKGLFPDYPKIIPVVTPALRALINKEWKLGHNW